MHALFLVNITESLLPCFVEFYCCNIDAFENIHIFLSGSTSVTTIMYKFATYAKICKYGLQTVMWEINSNI